MRITAILLTLMAAGSSVASAADLASLIRDGERKDALTAISSGADVNAAQPDGTTPLMWAIYRVDQELVKALLQRGAKANVRNVLGATPLAQAVEINDPGVVEQLLKAGADPNQGNADDQMPLMLAARAGSLPIVESLVKAGAKVNTREKFRGQSALMWAVGSNNPGAAAVTEFLIKNGAEVEFRAATSDWGNQITSEPRTQYRPTGGMTPLLYATRSGCLDCAKHLVKAGADINRPTPEGVTPVMNAIDSGSYAVANFLLDQGANPHLQDWWGRTALYIAIDMHSRGGAINNGAGRGVRGAGSTLGGFTPPAALAGIAGVDSNANPGAIAPEGSNQAAAPGATPNTPIGVAQRLLQMGVDPNVSLNMHRPFLGRFVDDLLNSGCTPLLRAAVGFDREAVELLLKHGAIVDLPNAMGVTPLMAASGIGWGGVGGSGPGQSPTMKQRPNLEDDAVAILDILVKAGADVNARITDTSSHTALIARPNSMSSRQGQTAIFGAIGAGTVNETSPPRNWLKVTQFLLDHGAKVDIKDARGVDLYTCTKGLAQGEQVSACGGRDSPSTPEMVALVRKAMGLPPEVAAKAP